MLRFSIKICVFLGFPRDPCGPVDLLCVCVCVCVYFRFLCEQLCVCVCVCVHVWHTVCLRVCWLPVCMHVCVRSVLTLCLCFHCYCILIITVAVFVVDDVPPLFFLCESSCVCVRAAHCCPRTCCLITWVSVYMCVCVCDVFTLCGRADVVVLIRFVLVCVCDWSDPDFPLLEHTLAFHFLHLYID